MMLYLVTAGVYSDTAIVALFSEDTLAQQLAAHLEDGQVIPLYVDAEANHLRLGFLPYAVWIDAPDEPDPSCYPGLPDVGTPEDADGPIYVWAQSPSTAIASARLRVRKE